MRNLFTPKSKKAEKEIQLNEKHFVASQWQLMWWKFQKHKLAHLGMSVLVILYLLAIFCEFFAPYTSRKTFDIYHNAPPQRIHFFDKKEGFQWPFVYDLKKEIDPKTWRRTYVEDITKKYFLHFFVRGGTYKLWNLFPSDLHFFGIKESSLFLFGTNEVGKDVFSRVIYGSRISLSIGLIAMGISFVLGLMIGGIAGYFGGIADEIAMRTIDFIMSIPTLPLWIALSAALPRDWPVVKTYFAISIIFSAIGWTGLARVVRGKLLALREEDFAVAGKIAGCTDLRIITRHLIPSFLSYVIVALTLGFPSMILGETALSFIGLGLQSPAVSWGVLLQDTQNVVAVAHHPWLLIPVIFVIVTILMFNFVGDGLRDAADPYK